MYKWENVSREKSISRGVHRWSRIRPFPNQKPTPSFVTQPTWSYTLQRLPVGPLIPRLTIRSFLHSSRKQDINGTNESFWYLTKIVPADDVEFPFLICWILHRFWGEFPWYRKLSGSVSYLVFLKVNVRICEYEMRLFVNWNYEIY